jgi:hypothetical protein
MTALTATAPAAVPMLTTRPAAALPPVTASEGQATP